MVTEVTVTLGVGFTVTLDIAVPVHAPVVPVTVYEVVTIGVAVALPPPVEVAPAVQVYELAPPAVNAAVCPAQMAGEFTVTVKAGTTETEATAVLLHPKAVPVTV